MATHPWDNDDELEDHEDPDPADQDSDAFESDEEEADTLPCPYCRGDVYDGADICPHCGSFILPDDARSRRPWWWILVIAACLAAVLLWSM